jgi:hypothetical protein
MTKHATEYDAILERFRRSGGDCECPGVGCDIATHVREQAAFGVGMTERGCAAKTTSGGLEVMKTSVVAVGYTPDPLDDADLRVFCAPCAEGYRRAMR